MLIPVLRSFNLDDPTTTVNKVAEYCLENTQTATHNVHAYTTHVLLKAKFIPSEYGRPAPNNNNPSTAQEADPKLVGDWMLINGGFYTFATLMEWIEAELKLNMLIKSLLPSRLLVLLRIIDI